MSRPEIMGVPLSRLEDPIHSAVSIYQRTVADNVLIFDADKACRLTLTPDKPNSARSESDVYFRRQLLGTLFVIAFKPGDGTGSEVTHKLGDLRVEPPYPRETKVVPRSKEGVHSEAHLTILRYGLENAHAYPELFQGTLDELTLDGGIVRKTHEVGQAIDENIIVPVATLTTGYRNRAGYPNGERFGDPHAIYNSIRDYLQVCAFLAISDEIHKMYSDALNALNPMLPRKVK